MRRADLKTDGTLYRAEPSWPIEAYERTDGSVVVKLLDLESTEAPRAYFLRDEKRPIKAEVVSTERTGRGGALAAGDTVFLSARRVLRTEEDHQERLRHRALAQERHERELAERNAKNATTARKLRGELERLGLDSLVSIDRETYRGSLHVRLSTSPEALLERLQWLTTNEDA